MTSSADGSATPGEQVRRLDVPGGPVDVVLGRGLAEVAEEVTVLWSHLLIEAGTPGAAGEATVLRYATAADSSAKSLGPRDPGACYKISGDVTRAVLRALVGQRILLHAGTVLLEGAGTTVLLGASGAGKSTAATVLGREGLYLSDELTIVDPADLAITAYPKPVSRVQRGRTKQDVALAELGLRTAPGAGPADTVVLLDRDPEAAEPSLTRVGLAEAVAVVAGQSSSLWRLPDPLGVIARMLTGAGGALRARYREATELAGLLADLPDRCPQPWETVDPDGTADPAGTGAPHRPAPGLTAAPFAQALRSEDATVVLQEGRTGTLTGLAELVWDLVREQGPIDPANLEALVVAEAGDHDRSADLVQAALEQVRSAGLLQEG